MLPVLRRNRIERKARRVARLLSELDARAGSPKRAKPQPRGNAASLSLGRI